MAMPLMTCRNPATGAQIVVSTYGGSLNYDMNQNLTEALSRQYGSVIAPRGTGGTFQYCCSYLLDLGNHGFLSLAPYDGGPGFMLSVFRTTSGSENFYFNPGECVVAP